MGETFIPVPFSTLAAVLAPQVATILNVTSAGVVTFNGRAGLIALTAGDVEGALSYTPANKGGDTFSGAVTLNAGGALSGTLTNRGTIEGGNYDNPTLTGGITADTTQPTLNGQTAAIAPIIDIEHGVLSGTIGNGGTVTAPIFYLHEERISGDHATLDNAAQIWMYRKAYSFGPCVGSRTFGHNQMQQNGAVTPDGNKNPDFGCEWITMTASCGGTSTSSTKGIVYGGHNPQALLLNGATYYTGVNAGGEIDIGVQPSSVSLTLSGSVTAGDIVGVTLESTAGGFNEALSISCLSTDSLGIVVNKIAAAILSDNVLQEAGIGVGTNGASSTGTISPDLLMIGWPQIIDLTVTTSVTGAGTEILTLGTQTVGASVGQKYGMTIIGKTVDGSCGFTNDAAIKIGKGSGNLAWSSGGWKTGVEIGGNVIIPQDPNNQFIVTGIWPFDPYADFLAANVADIIGGTDDAPIKSARMRSVINLPNVNFTLGGGGPIMLPGFQVNGDGSVQIGSGTVSRLTGSAGTAGIAISASGWEGVAVAVANGGGSPSVGNYTKYYYVGDVGVDDYGGQYQVESTGSLGDVEMFSVLVWPSAPAGTEPPGTIDIAQGSGRGWTMAVTWTPANTVQIGASGNTIELTGAIAINASVDAMFTTWMQGLPTTYPGSGGGPWLNGGALQLA